MDTISALGACFEVFDSEERGSLSFSEVRRLLDAFGFADEPPLHRVLRALGDGTPQHHRLTLAELIAAVSAEPMLFTSGINGVTQSLSNNDSSLTMQQDRVERTRSTLRRRPRPNNVIGIQNQEHELNQTSVASTFSNAHQHNYTEFIGASFVC